MMVDLYSSRLTSLLKIGKVNLTRFQTGEVACRVSQLSGEDILGQARTPEDAIKMAADEAVKRGFKIEEFTDANSPAEQTLELRQELRW